MLGKNSIVLLTNNQDKLQAARSVFDKYGINIEGTDLELHEIQADTSSEVAKQMTLEAYKKLRVSVLREDHSFFIGSTGIPGPYMSYFDKRIDVNTLISILKALNISKGYFELAAAFVSLDGKLYEFNYKVPIVFETEPRGDSNQRWERLMRFPDEKRVFAEYKSSERTEVWSKNFEKIAKLIQSQESI